MSTKAHDDLKYIDELTDEVGLVLRAGVWESGVASVIDQLPMLIELVDPEGARSPIEQVLDISERVKAAVQSLEHTDIGKVLAHFAGTSPSGYGQRLKVRRRLAADMMGVAVSTWRGDYEDGRVDLIAWRLTRNDRPASD